MNNDNIIGMLIRISFQKFDPKRRNKTAESEYAQRHGTKVDANRTTTRLVPKQFVERLVSFENKARAEVRHITTPFDDGGFRLITAEMVPQVQDLIGKLKLEHSNLVDDYVGEWDKIVAQARQDLNGDFAKFAANYPSAEEVRDRFQFNVTFLPMPDSSALLDAVRDEMSSVYEQRIADAGSDLRQRLADKLRHLADKCKTAGDKGTRFYETNVTNVLELCDILPKMLFDDDPELSDAIRQAREMLDGIDADAIKGSRMVADSVRSKANDILSSLI